MTARKLTTEKTHAAQNVYLRRKLREERVEARRLLTAKVERVNYDLWKQDVEERIAAINRIIRATNG